MVNVAIAGATGAVGRTLLEVMASQTRHRPFALTRSVPRKDDQLPAPTFQVNYEDIDSLKLFLEEHNIHTVICTFGINATSLAESQLNLIKAAEASSVTKRFIPSSFAIPYPEEDVTILPPLEHYFASFKALENSDLEWAPVYNGTFLEYIAPPTLKSYHPHSVLVLDVEDNMAAIPGDGNVPVTFTYTFDIACFVVAALDLEKWPRELRIVGDEMTFNEFLKLAEEVKGVKFDVTHDDIEKLKTSQITELPGHVKSYNKFPKDRLQWFLAIVETWMATGQARIAREGSLNEVFPEIKPLTARQMMEQYWRTGLK
ncbi:NmrA-like family protein [Aspergillus vadensis CBS 113365]|uniref:NmrA-like family protein n=1 Tax=Aspergillus vadensis (strain CBS 113365 / IMI 142717 / IBT 24658) TaxID=1448311 RepID=A0A319BIC4_ASPVC|nr:NmrA-like family protein [Aspergillus vadensis CBS 113365]PYH71689.1 NmrA-like family protein [Aspergillus vadensis CBS 113365]